MLPYVQPPAVATRRIGNEHSGIIEMEIRGGLKIKESRMISAMLAEHESALVTSAKLADAIATAENITITEAFDIVQAAVRGADLETAARAIMLRHAADHGAFAFRDAYLESLVAIRRAGARATITYGAVDAAKWLA